MHAQKFQIRYSPVQDRVLIIVTGEDARERVFGLTRRIVKRLVPGLRGIMGGETFARLTPDMPFDPPAPKQPAADPPQARVPGPGGDPAGIVTGAGNGDSAGDAAAEPAAAAGPPQPDIHLVTRLRIVEKAKGTHVLHISDSATTLNVPLNKDQIIQFTKGILTVLERCEWGLDWDAETGEQPADSAAAGVSDDAIDITADSPSRYRH